MLLLVTALLATAEAATAPAPALELRAFAGPVLSGYHHRSGFEGGMFALGGAEARYRQSFFSGEAGLYGGVPAFVNGPRGAGAAAARVGYAGERFRGTVGALVIYSPGVPGLSPLPSLNASLRFGELTASLGVFDRFALAPARLSAEWGACGAGWIFPLGGELFGRWQPSAGASLTGHLLYFSLAGSTVALAMVGGSFDVLAEER
jgi:hypothetical protein